MCPDIQTIFFDVGNTLRIVQKDQAFIDQAEADLMELIQTKESHDALFAKLESRWKTYRRQSKETLLDVSEGELWTQYMLPDYDANMIFANAPRLTRLWRKEADTKRYALVRSNRRFADRNLFLTIRDRRTTLIKPYQKDLNICHGVALDVLPLDGYPDSSWARKKQVIWALIYSLYCAQTIPENHGRVMAVGSRIALALVPSAKLRYRIWRFAEKQMTKYPIEKCHYITELCSGPG